MITVLDAFKWAGIEDPVLTVILNALGAEPVTPIRQLGALPKEDFIKVVNEVKVADQPLKPLAKNGCLLAAKAARLASGAEAPQGPVADQSGALQSAIDAARAAAEAAAKAAAAVAEARPAGPSIGTDLSLITNQLAKGKLSCCLTTRRRSSLQTTAKSSDRTIPIVVES